MFLQDGVVHPPGIVPLTSLQEDGSLAGLVFQLVVWKRGGSLFVLTYGFTALTSRHVEIAGYFKSIGKLFYAARHAFDNVRGFLGLTGCPVVGGQIDQQGVHVRIALNG